MPKEPYQLLQLAVAGLIACVLLRGLRRGWSRAHYLRATLDLGCCWMILFGPATENCTYVLLAPTLALTTWHAFSAGEPGWKRWNVLAIVSLFAVTAVVMMFPFGRHVSYVLMPIGALLLSVERLASIAWSPCPATSSPVRYRPLAQAA
jgi:hypothetical protein